MEPFASHGAIPWAQLPCGVLMSIARIAGGVGGLAEVKTRLRLVCRGFRLSLPLGHCKVWEWDPAMDASLAPHVLHLEVLAPLCSPDSCPLPRLPACTRLHRLTLRHVRSEALPALGALTRLRRLDATVLFSSEAPGWLDWASSLKNLNQLRLTAAAMRLQPEEGLTALLQLRRHLRGLRLADCLLLTDTGAALLGQLSLLERLEVTCCLVSQGAIDGLAAALPCLAHTELRLHDGIAVDRLLGRSCIAAPGGSLTARVTRTKASSLLASAGRQLAGAARLAVLHTGPGFLLTAEPSFHLLTALTSLRLPRIQLPPDAVAQLAARTRLSDLHAELHYTVRDESLLAWRVLGALTRLHLAGSFYLTEAAVGALLAALPRLQSLALEQLQGSGVMLAPLAGMPDLRSLELSACHLSDAEALTSALCSATELAHLRVQSCGIQSEVCEAVAAALRRLPRMRELELGLRRPPPRATVESIALGCAACTQLTALGAHFPGYNLAAPPLPAWRQLASLSRLRRLHVSSGLGWDAGALRQVLGAATGLRQLTLTDNAREVDIEWAEALAPLRQLSSLHLESCRQLDARLAPMLSHLTALTALVCNRCHGLEAGLAELQRLRASLPCLAVVSVHD